MRRELAARRVGVAGRRRRASSVAEAREAAGEGRERAVGVGRGLLGDAEHVAARRQLAARGDVGEPLAPARERRTDRAEPCARSPRASSSVSVAISSKTCRMSETGELIVPNVRANSPERLELGGVGSSRSSITALRDPIDVVGRLDGAQRRERRRR